VTAFVGLETIPCDFFATLVARRPFLDHLRNARSRRARLAKEVPLVQVVIVFRQLVFALTAVEASFVNTQLSCFNHSSLRDFFLASHAVQSDFFEVVRVAQDLVVQYVNQVPVIDTVTLGTSEARFVNFGAVHLEELTFSIDDGLGARGARRGHSQAIVR
jgi:hypothetical protein